MTAELLLVALASGCLGASIILAVVVRDIWGSKKRTSDWGGEAGKPRAA